MLEFREIHSDKRGKICVIKYGDREFLLLETNARYSRGGDYHKSKQHDIVLCGTVEFRMTLTGGEQVKVLGSGEEIQFENGVPHMLTSLTDSLVLEWLEGSFEKSYFKPYRERIEREIGAGT